MKIQSNLFLINLFILSSIIIHGCVSHHFVQYRGDTTTQNNNSIIILGDTQRTSFWEFWREQNDDERRKLLNAIADENPSAIIILGDLIFQGDSPHHWTLFNEFAAPIYQNKIPVFPLLGNHEYFGNNNIGLQLFYDHFPHLQKQLFYSFRLHGIAFIMLNSNFSHLTETQLSVQNDWYVRELMNLERNDSIKAIIVCSHHPPYTHSTVVSSDQQVQQYFLSPFLNTKKGAFFFSGHNHSYEHFIQKDKHIIVSGGGGGPRYSVSQNPSNIPEDIFKGSSKRFFHYCQLTPSLSGLHLTVKGFDNKEESVTVKDEIDVELK